MGVENCHLPLTKPVAVNTGLALPRSPWFIRRQVCVGPILGSQYWRYSLLSSGAVAPTANPDQLVRVTGWEGGAYASCVRASCSDRLADDRPMSRLSDSSVILTSRFRVRSIILMLLLLLIQMANMSNLSLCQQISIDRRCCLESTGHTDVHRAVK